MGPVDATRERILDGAMHAIAEHGLAGLAMRDVGCCAHVARGTVYRYFPNREALLDALMQREGRRFLEQWRRSLADAPQGPARVKLAFAYPSRLLRDHPALRKLVESDPDYVLRALRENYAAIRATVAEYLGPVLAENDLVRRGAMSVEQITDWSVRVMVSSLLFPDPDPDALAGGLDAIHRALSSQAA
jgi:AcrR family transcriptional regulator